MEIKQRKFTNQSIFDFGDESLKFTTKDKSGRYSFSVNYASIPTDAIEFEERNMWYRNVGAAWLLIGVLMMTFRYLEEGVIRGSMWVTFGFVFLIIYWVAKTSYTIIETERGKIFIIKDKKYDAVLNEIYSRRNGQLFSWYGAIDYENDPTNEINKFYWLVQQDVISQDEADKIKNRIIAYHESAETNLNEREIDGDDGQARILN